MPYSKILEKLNERLHDTRDIVEKVTQISIALKEIIGADRCTIFVYDSDSDTFWSAYVDGVSFIEIPRGKGLVSKVFEDKKPTIYNDVKSHTSHLKGIDRGSEYFTRTMITAPIMNYANEPIGVVQILNKHNNQNFTDSDLDILLSLLDYIVEFVEGCIVRHSN